MTEMCLINGLIKALCIQDYVLYGILLILAGILMLIYIPFDIGKKIGGMAIGLGVIFAIFFPIVVGWWNNSIEFQITVMAGVIFAIIYFILFSKEKEGKK